MDAIILCRISDIKQDDGYSLDAQERFGREYCKNKNFKVNETFRFIETGSKSHKREKFDGMVDYIREYVDANKKKTLHLVVEKSDRLTRNFTNREQLQFFVMMGHLVIHYYKDRRILDQNCSPADIFTDDMMTSVSKYMALNSARETKKGLSEKARNGWFPGYAPLGYKNVREGDENKHGRKEAKILVDETTKKAVLRIFELRALHGYSYLGIRDEILKEKLLPEKKAKRFAKTSVEQILANPFYGGKFFYANEWHQGKHEVFVPAEWIRLSHGRRGTAHTNFAVGPFSHLMTCGVPGCGSTIIYDPKTKINKTAGTSRQFHYYHCADGRRFHKVNQLRQVNVNEAKLWDLFIEPIREISITEELADFIMDHLNQIKKQSTESDAVLAPLSEITADGNGMKITTGLIYDPAVISFATSIERKKLFGKSEKVLQRSILATETNITHSPTQSTVFFDFQKLGIKDQIDGKKVKLSLQIQSVLPVDNVVNKQDIPVGTGQKKELETRL